QAFWSAVVITNTRRATNTCRPRGRAILLPSLLPCLPGATSTLRRKARACCLLTPQPAKPPTPSWWTASAGGPSRNPNINSHQVLPLQSVHAADTRRGARELPRKSVNRTEAHAPREERWRDERHST